MQARWLQRLHCTCTNASVSTSWSAELLHPCGSQGVEHGAAELPPTHRAVRMSVPMAANFCATYQSRCVDASLSAAYNKCTEDVMPPRMITRSPADQFGNSLGCRMYHLRAAEQDPSLHCPHAGPDGSNVCVGPPPKPDFCTGYHSTCVVTSKGAAYPECVADIAEMAAGVRGDATGDTIACRIHHLDALGSNNISAASCANAGPGGGSMCVGPAPSDVAFCSTYSHRCAATNKSSTYANCTTAVADMAVGTKGDQTGNSMACRAYHLELAAANPDLHCPHASSSGGDVCIGRFPPVSFCRAYQLQCVDSNLSNAYVDCPASVDAMRPGDDTDNAGDTLGCRTFHVGNAAKYPFDQERQCRYASPDGGSVCVGPPLAAVDFCYEYNAVCVTNLLSTPYVDCAADVVAMTRGTPGDTTGDTAACRAAALFGLRNGSDPRMHCMRAGPNGSDTCISRTVPTTAPAKDAGAAVLLAIIFGAVFVISVALFWRAIEICRALAQEKPWEKQRDTLA